ncbi:sigma 54-interacting transcriptional regulator [Marinisporobacter balticus]|uniref:HTH-type transcriptional regulatory protein TyrR n=1 Tax=Marinisporobacter balticus TaxID=2018667 RepID=A0A4R2L7K1_9FIRM|nr:sigma 54-interacting transcriptional regulator [Marinisporobacter balticus]TCO75205.1 PAS domain S-box-containing protein [Marinisporobacter balticus]
MKVKEAMTRDPIILTMNDTLNHAVNIFIKNHIDGIPIVDEQGKLINVITKTDIMKAFVNKVSPLMQINKIASKRVVTILEDAEIQDAWHIKVGCLPVINAQGNLVGILTRTDLSKRLFENEVQESSELKTVLNLINNGIIIINREGVITRCNAAARRILNLDNQSIIGFKIKDVLPELKLHEVIEKGVHASAEKIYFKNKTLICERIPLFKDKEVFAGVIAFKDSYDLQSVIDELNTVQQLSEKLDAVIESSYDGIYITDGQANTVKINKSYERITGVNREEMLDKNMLELEKSRCVSESATLRVLETKGTVTIHQKFRTGKNALVTSTPILDENGEIIMVVTNVRDITELAKLKKQLEKNKELTQKYYSEIEEMRMQLLNTLHIVAQDEKMLETMRIAKRVAKVDTTVLVLGETGVGKEEVAKFIHKNSNRRRNQFIKINCGAIPVNLIESELFGYEKGAFTGANREGKVGLFEIADGGTLFLDEVGELSLDIQVKLLRVLQEHEIKRIGGNTCIKIDVRILAATNRNLERMVKEKCFREDLYYRLNVIPMNIPPLRERRGDILPLVSYFLSELNEKYGWNKEFSKEALESLYEYAWLGNVRELKNIVERVVIMSNEDRIILNDLPKEIIAYKHDKNLMISPQIIPLKDAVANVEKNLLDKAFEKYGNVRDAAKVLGIDASTFVRKRQKYKTL